MRRGWRMAGGSVVTGALVALGGCGDPGPVNPAFAVSTSQAKQALAEMRQERRKLSRPVIILGGYGDPGVAAHYLKDKFGEVTSDRRVIGVSFFFDEDFDACRARVIRAVDEAFPNHDPQETAEVDVIGMSMGGVVARYAAGEGAGRRLKIARLFTISSPLRGAKAAKWPTWNRLQKDLRRDSAFMANLAAAPAADYSIVSYTRLGDEVVGEENTAVADAWPYWVSNLRFQEAHAGAMIDVRIRADIARRLRGEQPLATAVAGPWPGAMTK